MVARCLVIRVKSQMHHPKNASGNDPSPVKHLLLSRTKEETVHIDQSNLCPQHQHLRHLLKWLAAERTHFSLPTMLSLAVFPRRDPVRQPSWHSRNRPFSSCPLSRHSLATRHLLPTTPSTHTPRTLKWLSAAAASVQPFLQAKHRHRTTKLL